MPAFKYEEKYMPKYRFEMNGYQVHYRESGNEVYDVYVFDEDPHSDKDIDITELVNMSEYEEAAQADFNRNHREY